MSQQTDRLSAALSDRYRIERELGAGGMATVYLAQDLKHDRKVAIKVLKPELAAVLGAERFVVEIKTTAAMSHPHILPLFDSGTADGFLFYVMPYIQGETIREKLNRETQFGVDEAVRIAREVADALDYAHRHGVIHRDIKPENILLHDGRAMVMDFGIALAVSAAAGGRMTETGLSLGTPHYMSPEQATAEKEITARSDVYSLASVLYEMLAGEPPHTAGNAQAVIMKIITDVARPMHELRRNVPANVSAALGKALEKLPADRFESAAKFAEALANPHFNGGVHAATARAAANAAGVRGALPWVVAALATVVAAVLAVRDDPPAPQRATRFAVTAPGIELTRGDAIAVSNDGQHVVFAGVSGGVTRLYLRTLDDPVPHVLNGTDGVLGVAISPDSRWVVFSASDNRIKRVALTGGAVETLARATYPGGMTWNERLGPVLGMPMMSGRYNGLTTIPPRPDTLLRELTLGDSGAPGSFRMHHFPVALADGNTIMYTDFNGSAVRLGVFTLDDSTARTLDINGNQVAGVAGDVMVYLEGRSNLMAALVDLKAGRVIGEPVQVPVPTGTLRDAAMSPTGTLAILVNPSSYQAVIVDERGAAEPLTPDTVGSVWQPRFTPDGRHVVADGNVRGSRATWLYDMGARTLSKLNNGVASVVQAAALSTDGRRFLNVKRVGSATSYEWVAIDESRAPEKLPDLAPEAPIASVAVAPGDRAFVIGTAYRSGSSNLMQFRPGVDSVPVPFVATDANEVSPSFSPDGKWVAYASDESGRYEVYAKPYPGPGGRVQISDAGGGEPVWARDGRRLFYRNGHEMLAAEIARNGNALTVRRRESLFSGDYFGGASLRGAMYDVSPDGRRFVMARAFDGAGTQLFVWTGWLDEVRRMLRERAP